MNQPTVPNLFILFSLDPIHDFDHYFVVSKRILGIYAKLGTYVDATFN